jgi:CoA:oxalate CoA-transferase
MANRPQMLQGYRVLDFTQFVAGPTCTRILGEMGAEVIKVELAPGGDRVRAGGYKPMDPKFKDSQSTYYVQHDHSKLSLCLDSKQPRARELLLAMIPKIDVLVENFAPGVIGRIGLSYDVVKKIRPDIVMCSISMAGQTGPLSYKPGYDYMGQAYAGVTNLIGEPDRPPSITTMAIGDISTGVSAAMAVGFSLLNRERTGEGQFIDASLIDTYFHMHELNVPLVSLRGGQYEPNRSGSLAPAGAPTGIYKAGDEGYIFLTVLPHQWPQLLRAMNMPAVAEDPRFRSDRARTQNKEALKSVIEGWLGGFPSRDAALAALDKERVACAPVLKLSESMAHPHLRERKTVRRVKDRFLGELDIPGMPVKFSGWPQNSDIKVSRLGEDNETVLRTVLGMSDAEIAKLYDEKVLFHDPTIGNGA